MDGKSLVEGCIHLVHPSSKFHRRLANNDNDNDNDNDNNNNSNSNDNNNNDNGAEKKNERMAGDSAEPAGIFNGDINSSSLSLPTPVSERQPAGVAVR